MGVKLISTLFTADQHWFHTNSIQYCNRPFKTVDDMNSVLIDNWNSVVRPQDVVWHLGDFCFAKGESVIEYLCNSLNGKINLVLGNHDKYIKNHRHVYKYFENVYNSYVETKVNGVDMTLCHYAMRVWNKSHWGSWHLYGHSHGTLPDINTSLSIDVGVDARNYTPISFEEVEAIMRKKNFVPIDKRQKEAEQVKQVSQMNGEL